MGPFFKFILAESWGCPGMLRMHSGFKALRLFAHGLQTLSRLLNARALSGSNPQPPFFALKKGPKWDPSFNSYWRRAGDSNPRCPFGAYSLSRRAPSASRSALRNSRSIVTKQSRMGKGEFWSDSILPAMSQPIISICNRYRPNLRPDVTDLDKRSAPSANVSICNSYRPNRPVYVTDQDKPIPRNTIYARSTQISPVPTAMPPLPQRAVEGAEFVVAHGAPHLIDATAC